jgi:hypothetical protein
MKGENLFVLGYALPTWAVRMDEWSIALMLSLLFPSNLLYISIYAFATTSSVIIFGPSVGRLVKSNNRLSSLSCSIIIQLVSFISHVYVFNLHVIAKYV